ncbi:MAG: hypothetical protein QM731_26640 [Chitinophagaceae bacterium]
MISQYELPAYLREVMPQTDSMELTVRAQTNLYTSLQCFTRYTGKAFLEHNTKLAGKCCRLAERLYVNGDALVKNAIENIFIYAFPVFLSGNKKQEGDVKELIPACLYNIYVKQVMQSGC